MCCGESPFVHHEVPPEYPRLVHTYHHFHCGVFEIEQSVKIPFDPVVTATLHSPFSLNSH